MGGYPAWLERPCKPAVSLLVGSRYVERFSGGGGVLILISDYLISFCHLADACGNHCHWIWIVLVLITIIMLVVRFVRCVVTFLMV